MLSKQDKQEIRTIAKEKAEANFQEHNDSDIEFWRETNQAISRTQKSGKTSVKPFS